MKPCDRYEELISRLVDGELNREEYDALIAHIGECSRCNALYAAFNAMSDLMREEPAPLPEGLHENIMAGVRRSAIEKKNRRMRVVWTRTALTAAACLALVLFASRGFAPDKKAESAALRSKEAAEEILPAAPMDEAALPDEVQEATPAEPSAAPLPEKTPAPTPVPVLEGNPAPLPSPSGSPVAAAGSQSPTVTESPRPTPGATAKPAASAAAVSTPTPVPASTAQPSAVPSVTPAPTAQASPETTAAAAPTEAPQSPAVSAAAEQPSQTSEAAVQSPAVSASAVTPSPEVQMKSGAVQSDAAAAEPVPAAEESAAPSLRAAPKPQESEPPAPAASESPAAAAETEQPEETPVSTRKGLRSLFKMPLLSLEPDPGQSAEDETVESAEPSPSEEPSPTPSPTPSAEASPAETSPVIIRLEIRADADYDELMELLDLESAKLPEGKPSRIYRILRTPEKEGTASEELEIYVIDDEVYCLRSTSGTAKTYRAGCSAAELKTLIKRLQAAASPEPEESAPPLPGLLKPKPVSEKSTETPAPSGTPESSPRVSEALAAHAPPAGNEK